MANASGGSEEQLDRSHGPRECMACRGSGQVISNLGGTAKRIACPWCDGTGLRKPGADAQAHWSGSESAENVGESPENEG